MSTIIRRRLFGEAGLPEGYAWTFFVDTNKWTSLVASDNTTVTNQFYLNGVQQQDLYKNGSKIYASDGVNTTEVKDNDIIFFTSIKDGFGKKLLDYLYATSFYWPQQLSAGTNLYFTSIDKYPVDAISIALDFTCGNNSYTHIAKDANGNVWRYEGDGITTGVNTFSTYNSNNSYYRFTNKDYAKITLTSNVVIDETSFINTIGRYLVPPLYNNMSGNRYYFWDAWSVNRTAQTTYIIYQDPDIIRYNPGITVTVCKDLRVDGLGRIVATEMGNMEISAWAQYGSSNYAKIFGSYCTCRGWDSVDTQVLVSLMLVRSYPSGYTNNQGTNYYGLKFSKNSNAYTTGRSGSSWDSNYQQGYWYENANNPY